MFAWTKGAIAACTNGHFDRASLFFSFAGVYVLQWWCNFRARLYTFTVLFSSLGACFSARLGQVRVKVQDQAARNQFSRPWTQESFLVFLGFLLWLCVLSLLSPRFVARVFQVYDYCRTTWNLAPYLLGPPFIRSARSMDCGPWIFHVEWTSC